ncbi:sortase domain-containing protein [Natronoglycomyces albus]|uniref:Sortase n=1 Tax=Natronoglycomyces albus TaxID=2811108 RepID=A0A895XNQ7_9ACTN|nr:sortase [Natronoglycomyces albus]QSB05402.1 sortase [Natronoglycomyces albus]
MSNYPREGEAYQRPSPRARNVSRTGVDQPFPANEGERSDHNAAAPFSFRTGDSGSLPASGSVYAQAQTPAPSAPRSWDDSPDAGSFTPEAAAGRPSPHRSAPDSARGTTALPSPPADPYGSDPWATSPVAGARTGHNRFDSALAGQADAGPSPRTDSVAGASGASAYTSQAASSPGSTAGSAAPVTPAAPSAFASPPSANPKAAYPVSSPAVPPTSRPPSVGPAIAKAPTNRSTSVSSARASVGPVDEAPPTSQPRPHQFDQFSPSPTRAQQDDRHPRPSLATPDVGGSAPAADTLRLQISPPNPTPSESAFAPGATTPSPAEPSPSTDSEKDRSPASLIPGPDETAILPQIPADPSPAPEGADKESRRKQSVKRHRDHTGPADVVRKVVRGAGEILVTFGVIVMLFAAYEIWGVSAQINSARDEASATLDDLWAEPIPEEEDGAALVPEMGDAFARMWAPDIRSEPWVLVEGTDLADIEWAPGRWRDGAYPGEQGNMTLAGHNVPAIFQRIRDLQPGDKVVVETRDNFFVYEVRFDHVVEDTAMEIVAPVPPRPDGSAGGPGVEPGDEDYWLTLFTCDPLWDNTHRYVVTAQLTDTLERGEEMPEAAIQPNR